MGLSAFKEISEWIEGARTDQESENVHYRVVTFGW